MKSKLFFFISGISLLLCFGSLALKWNGNASVNVSFPVSGTSVQFCGAAKGWTALLALLFLLAAIAFFVIAIIRWLLTEPANSKQANQ